MVVRRSAVTVALFLLTSFVASVPAGAQDAGAFVMLGEDATGDGSIPDTWVDINSLAVATVGTDLVFHLGLEGTTTEAGSYCWMAAFEVDGEEFVGLDCYEAVAGVNDNTLSGASRPDTSRGTNVASSVTFDGTGAVITIPLAAIGAEVGTAIDDIYGLTYVTRALNVVDTIPDAKSAAAADESLGSYVIGGVAAPGEAIVAAAKNVTEDLTVPGFLHEFTNATSDDYALNLTVPWSNVTFQRTARVVSGSANVTVLHNGTPVAAFRVTNETHPATAAANATAGNATAAGNATVGGNATAGNATAGNATADNATADASEPVPASAAVPSNATGNATGNSTADPAAATGNATGPLIVGNATGNWTIRIDYDGFVGTLGLNVTEYVAPPVMAPETAVKDSPGFAALPFLAVLVVAVVALRRRA